jgi:hypothetical protein
MILLPIVVYKNVQRAYRMYRFFEQSRNASKQPSKIAKFWTVYKAVRTR